MGKVGELELLFEGKLEESNENQTSFVKCEGPHIYGRLRPTDNALSNCLIRRGQTVGSRSEGAPIFTLSCKIELQRECEYPEYHIPMIPLINVRWYQLRKSFLHL